VGDDLMRGRVFHGERGTARGLLPDAVDEQVRVKT
jgi:hypothetical protein